MNDEIVYRWNTVVEPNDIVYHLGDVMLGDDYIGGKYLQQLNGNIYITLGNHDSEKREAYYKQFSNVKDVQMGYRLKAGKKILILSHYPTIVTNFKEEYPKVINLCGHTHTKDPFKDIENGCYHVELDAHDCYPVKLETILDEIRAKKIELLSK